MQRIGAWLVGAWLLASAPALAEAAPPDPERALELGREALDLYKKGQWAEALRGFEQAEATAHSPAFVLYLARCKRNMQQLLAARALFRRVIDEALPQSPPEAWKAAQGDAAEELARLETQIPAIVPKLRDDPGDVALRVDGATVAAGAVVELDPGSHRLEGLRGAEVVTQRELTLAPGDGTMVVELELPAPARVATVDAPERYALPTEPEPGSIVPGVVTLAVGAAGLIAGAVTGGIALSQQNEVLGRCQGDQCLASDEELADTAVTLSHVSTATLIAGGALAATGTVLLIVRPGGADRGASLAFGARF